MSPAISPSSSSAAVSGRLDMVDLLYQQFHAEVDTPLPSFTPLSVRKPVIVMMKRRDNVQRFVDPGADVNLTGGPQSNATSRRSQISVV